MQKCISQRQSCGAEIFGLTQRRRADLVLILATRSRLLGSINLKIFFCTKKLYEKGISFCLTERQSADFVVILV